MVLLADARTNGFCVHPLVHQFSLLQCADRIIIPQGEAHKNMDSCMLIWQQLTELQADRNTVLVNVGGGMVCDLGGFAASVYKRGISFIHIPTTLLAMCDAGIGGKTGIDFQGYKNHLGTFNDAEALYIDPNFLDTLDFRTRKSGIAEMIKHDLLQGGDIWNQTYPAEEQDFYTLQKIRQSMAFKQMIVAQDPRDEHIRQCLNFGHSIGHAIESYALQTEYPLLHGEAIIYGMYYELLLSRNILGLEDSILQQFDDVRRKLFPELQATFTLSQLTPFLLQDKKNNRGLRMSLLKGVGQCEVGVMVSPESLQNLFS